MMQSWKQRLLAEPEPKQAPVMGWEKEHLLFLKYFYFNHTLYYCFFCSFPCNIILNKGTLNLRLYFTLSQ